MILTIVSSITLAKQSSADTFETAGLSCEMTQPCYNLFGAEWSVKAYNPEYAQNVLLLRQMELVQQFTLFAELHFKTCQKDIDDEDDYKDCLKKLTPSIL